VIALAVLPCYASPVRTQTAAQTQARATDAEIYANFRAWVTKLPPDAQQTDVMGRYRTVLAGEGLNAAEVDRRIRVITEQGQRLEIEMWNRVLTAPKPFFNTKPNAFLTEMIRGVKPGTALDVGMGQGRNALFLAQQGWTVTGFDPADKAVAAAQEEAKRLGVNVTTLVARDDQFDFGTERWDLVVLSYVTLRHLIPQIRQSLKPGGLAVVEAFHRDATKNQSIGSGVVYDTNELLKLFDRFRVIRYEDTEGTADFGLQNLRLVRLCAQKP
jgi:SAM-dependent methyltransferase